MTFEKQGFEVIKNIISDDVADLCYEYLLQNSKVLDALLEKKYISPISGLFGFPEDGQVPGAYSAYGNVLMEVLLLKLKPQVEKVLNKKLVENYAYARVYNKGNTLDRHKDRFSCQFSTTLHLGGGEWPIYIEPDESKGGWVKGIYTPGDSDGVEINLNKGDMLIYKGNVCEHWRNKLENEHCGQVFFHYTSTEHEAAERNRLDGRPMIGLPSWYSKGVIQATDTK